MNNLGKVIVGIAVLAGGATAPLVPVTYEMAWASDKAQYDTIDGDLHQGDFTILPSGQYVGCNYQTCADDKGVSLPITQKESQSYTQHFFTRWIYPIYYKDPSTGDMVSDTLPDKTSFDDLTKKDAINPTKVINKSIVQIISQ